MIDHLDALMAAMDAARTKDAVATFLDVEYMTSVINRIEEKSDRPVSKVEEVTTIAKRLSFPQSQIDVMLDHFVRGGQMTVGGVMNAVTSVAQTLPDADAAHDMEGAALRVLEVV